MNKRILAAVIVLVAVIGVVFGIYALTRPNAIHEVAASSPAASTSSAAAPSASPTTAAPEPSPGRYLDYATAEVPASTGRTFLFFYASWCGQCHEIDGDILAQGVPDDVTIVKVNWDTEQAAEQHYGVPMRTTFVELDANGAVLQKFVAYDTPTFAAVRAAMNF